MGENPGARVEHSLKRWEPEALWGWDGGMANWYVFSIIPKAGVQSQCMNQALMVFSSLMDSSKECCIAHTLDDTEDNNV